MNQDRERGDELSLAERFPRPPAVELGAAILIVSGILGLIGAIGGAGTLPPGTELLLAATIALDTSSVLVGVFIRMGRLWILDVNYVAVVGFLDLLGASASPLALILGLGNVTVVVILVLYRPWFQRRAGRDPDRDDGELDRP